MENVHYDQMLGCRRLITQAFLLFEKKSLFVFSIGAII